MKAHLKEFFQIRVDPRRRVLRHNAETKIEELKKAKALGGNIRQSAIAARQAINAAKKLGVWVHDLRTKHWELAPSRNPV